MFVESEIHDCRDGQQVRTHTAEQWWYKDSVYKVVDWKVYFELLADFITPSVTDWFTSLKYRY